MQYFKIIKHSDLNEDMLNLICEIKSIHWPYPIESQKRWLSENLKSDDIHALLFEDEVLVGYMNLVNVKAIINNSLHSIAGIGNVCSRKIQMGYGGKLMTLVRAYLVETNTIGLLFCQSAMVNFYIRFQGVLIPPSRVKLPNIQNRAFETMVVNCPFEVQELIYKDRIF